MGLLRHILSDDAHMEKRRWAIVGVTGFIGSGLVSILADQGIEVTGISRSGTGNVAGVKTWQSLDSLDLRGHECVINLAGEPVDQRWTRAIRESFYQSRVVLTQKIVAALASIPEEERPRTLINASAVGYYGDSKDSKIDESSPAGESYLAQLCHEWEQAAMEAQNSGVRVTTLRIGIVLGRHGRAFEKLMLVFRSGIGGRLGAGDQWMPWIHVHDLRRAIMHIADQSDLTGPINGTAPFPERNRDFTHKLAKAVRRPAIFPVPSWALKIVLGEFAEVLLSGQKALPKVLLESGFCFDYPTLESALTNLTAR